jgi:uncharacterized protein YdhG (YjbR/CyaY superfamily)
MVTFKPRDINDYIAGFPEDIQKLLNQIRKLVKKAAPDAVETIKYSMPTFMLNGNLVYFAAFKQHIGFYPAPSRDEQIKKALAGYKIGKGSVQFPFDKPLPADLITKIVKFRIKQNLEKAGKKEKK